MEFFNSFGPEGIKVIQEFDIPIFLDLKLHDIPATVYKTVRTLLTLNPAIINVHASGGKRNDDWLPQGLVRIVIIKILKL